MIALAWRLTPNFFGHEYPLIYTLVVRPFSVPLGTVGKPPELTLVVPKGTDRAYYLYSTQITSFQDAKHKYG